jgi:sugar lactone lactonase YvrE
MPERIVARPFFRPESEELRYLPECPRVIGGKLFWVSIQYGPCSEEGGLNELDLATRVHRHHRLAGRPGFFVPTGAPDLLLIGLERRLIRFDLADGLVLDTLAELPEDPQVIINEGTAVPGGVIFGTKHLQFTEPIAALYRFDWATGEVRLLRGGQVCSNGKYLRGHLLVDVDSQPRTITEYRLEHELTPLRVIAPPDSLPAIPDGLRPAPGGESIIVAFYNPQPVSDGIAQEIRLSDGKVLREWVLPGSPRVTCPEIAELDGRACVFFTTAVESMKAEHRALAPEAGTLFVADLTA